MIANQRIDQKIFARFSWFDERTFVLLRLSPWGSCGQASRPSPFQMTRSAVLCERMVKGKDNYIAAAVAAAAATVTTIITKNTTTTTNIKAE